MDDTDLQPLFPSTKGTTSWLEANADIFPSEESLRWFFRQHRQELVETGAVVLVRAAWFANPATLRAAVMNIARRAALKAAAQA